MPLRRAALGYPVGTTTRPPTTSPRGSCRCTTGVLRPGGGRSGLVPAVAEARRPTSRTKRPRATSAARARWSSASRRGPHVQCCRPRGVDEKLALQDMRSRTSSPRGERKVTSSAERQLHERLRPGDRTHSRLRTTYAIPLKHVNGQGTVVLSEPTTIGPARCLLWQRIVLHQQTTPPQSAPREYVFATTSVVAPRAERTHHARHDAR